MNMASKTTTIILSAILVIALIASGYFYFTLTKSQSQVADLTSQLNTLKYQISQGNLNITLTKADIFDAKLHDLLQEHTFLLVNTIRRSFDSSASYNASLVALQNNINEVGQLLTPIYGTANASQLVNLWNNKTNIFIAYSNAMKTGDSTANTVFASNAASYEQAVAAFWLSTANPYPIIGSDTILPMVTAHVNDVKAAVDVWNSKDYTTYFADLEVAYKQAGIYADTIAQGIINQNPTLFI
jgi:hypothetical protein